MTGMEWLVQNQRVPKRSPSGLNFSWSLSQGESNSLPGKVVVTLWVQGRHVSPTLEEAMLHAAEALDEWLAEQGN